MRLRAGWCLRRSRWLPAATAIVLLSCSDDRASVGPRAGEPAARDPELGADADLDLTYVCGNRFVVSNAQATPVDITFRVTGTAEEGTAEVDAAPDLDPAVGEATIETRATGAVELLRNGRSIVTRANGRVPCTPAAASLAAVTAPSDSAGQWTAPFDWPIVAVHMMLLPDGRVLSLGRQGTPHLWEPATGAFTSVASPAQLFCSGHALLANGEVFVAGGHISNNHGLPNTTLFGGGAWQASAPMARGRWYPTTTVTGNGDVVILAGRDEAGLVTTVPEVWSAGAIRQLTGAPKSLPYYPRAFLAPNGTVFVAGSSARGNFLSVAGAGSWKQGPKLLYGAREYGSAVMYDQGKILYAGGSRSTNTAEIVDLNQPAPVWAWTGSMARARRHLNLTVLPTGDVLATGGVGGTTFNDLTVPTLAAELWSPTTGQWTTLASSAIPRGYHATSLLLPDGRVLHAGSGDGSGAPNQRNAELFSPPYLFRGARPIISGAPASVPYGERFRIETPDAGTIGRVSFIRLGAVTHAFDQNQRFQWLPFTADPSGLEIVAPASANAAPPGHYLVFLLTGDGVPSVGAMVKLE